MQVINWKDCETAAIEQIGYRDKMLPVKGVTIRWLSKCGQDEAGNPAYGLRFFSVEGGGEIPIHSHAYVQTMYIMSGRFECWEFDPQTDELTEKVECSPGDSIFVASMAPHGMKNMSDSETATFLCCIGNVD